ncbi:MAG: hypothetical protein VX112_02345 [Pseudomonadota bacterium]|nr:hypothetical protein [Pseudomonadota bacterium]
MSRALPRCMYNSRPSSMLYYVSFSLLILAAISCLILAYLLQHTQNTFPVISATYILYPERLIFSLGITYFVAIQYVFFHPISKFFTTPRITPASTLSPIITNIDDLHSVSLILLYLVGWMPDVIFYGIHSILAITLFVSLLHLQYCIYKLSVVLYGPKSVLTRFRFILYLLSCAMLAAIPLVVPWSFIREFLGSSGHIRYILLTHDPRIFWVAIFEWLYAILCLVHLASLGYEINNNKKISQE